MNDQTVLKKPSIVFVGSFRGTISGGGVGGQMYACKTLIRSPISQVVDWSLLDSTMISVPPPNLVLRLGMALRRVACFTWLLISAKRASVLIFSGDGPSFLEKGLMALIARWSGLRVVFCPRSGMLLDDLERSAVYRWYIPFVLRRVSVVLAQGPSWERLFSEFVRGSAARVIAIPNWIDTTSYKQEPARGSTRGAAVVALYLGWLEPFKGILDLVEAVSIERQSLENARFIICGSGSQLDLAKAKAHALGVGSRFEFRGWVDEVGKSQALREADLLVLPSHREGMPNAVLEAMASGLAVVATSVGAIPGVVEQGVTGSLVPPGAPIALGQELARLMNDPQLVARMGAAGYKTILARHDICLLWRQLLYCLLPGHSESMSPVEAVRS